MSDQRKQILEMLAEGKIDVSEAEQLFDALSDGGGGDSEIVSGDGNKKPKYLHIKVTADPGSDHKRENVDIKVPLILLKAGMKLGALMPEKAHGKFSSHLAERGIDFDLKNMDSEKIDLFVQALTESSIDIDSDKEKVKIYCS